MPTIIPTVTMPDGINSVTENKRNDASTENKSHGLNALDDRRIREIKPLVPPQILMEDLPLSNTAQQTIQQARRYAENIIHGSDDRLLVIVGPCSIHDPKAALDYAQRLLDYSLQASDDLLIIMRVYFEKPRTTVGWKGLINDPFMDGSFKINKGLFLARQLLLAINEMGLPTGYVLTHDN
jgi:3-deoxy-7-phosphoheptulonate synthase